MKTRAFTLIELLIVVAIIAILAAIAVPNFLEAQTRSKVTRAKADMRALATAMESYCVDNNNYPVPLKFSLYLMHDVTELTTPISYITSTPADTFGYADHWGGGTTNPGVAFPAQRNTGYKYSSFKRTGTGSVTSTNNPSWADQITLEASLVKKGYVIYSYGPDKAQCALDWFAVGKKLPGIEGVNSIYDPTNGTVSNGDIGRTGGVVLPEAATLISR